MRKGVEFSHFRAVWEVSGRFGSVLLSWWFARVICRSGSRFVGDDRGVVTEDDKTRQCMAD